MPRPYPKCVQTARNKRTGYVIRKASRRLTIAATVKLCASSYRATHDNPTARPTAAASTVPGTPRKARRSTRTSPARPHGGGAVHGSAASIAAPRHRSHGPLRRVGIAHPGQLQQPLLLSPRAPWTRPVTRCTVSIALPVLAGGPSAPAFGDARGRLLWGILHAATRGRKGASRLAAVVVGGRAPAKGQLDQCFKHGGQLRAAHRHRLAVRGHRPPSPIAPSLAHRDQSKRRASALCWAARHLQSSAIGAGQVRQHLPRRSGRGHGRRRVQHNTSRR